MLVDAALHFTPFVASLSAAQLLFLLSSNLQIIFFSFNTPSLKNIIKMNIIEPEQRRIQELATRYGMTREEMELIIYDIQQKDLSLEWLKQPRVQQIIKHRKGRWVHVSAYV